MDFKQTNLWKRTLANQSNDTEGNQEARTRLREAYLRMRDHAAALVSSIPDACKGLTVHDISHLDALWDVADTIVGPDYELTPVEAFVFGGAVMLHDAGLSAAAYPDGIAGLERTTEWRDAASTAIRRTKQRVAKREEIDNPPSDVRQEVIFGTLRALHARQAEQLATMAWPVPLKPGEQIRLLEESHLRSAYGKSIGRIAHSHHWNIERLGAEFNRDVGAATQLPASWTLDEVKVACLLRCADAAHIDHRRAPTMLFSLTRPHGASADHWSFQNKINQAVRKDDALVYSAGSTFSPSEANAWWLCFDTIRMIDRELSSCSALMQEANIAPFAVRRVIGAATPALLAKYIKTDGWRPVNAEVRVSDPVGLAQTLGGRNLYGRETLAPIRELLQNATDAVRARRLYEPRPSDWGSIRVTFEEGDATHRGIWMHIDDTGVGMSERVLTTSLLDFGKSFWTSSLFQDEFPGLQGKGLDTIGRYGIGFFSVFLLGNQVRVTSRRFDAGLAEARTLDFETLTSRPIVRNANAGELPIDFNTRVSVLITEDITPPVDVALLGRKRPDWTNKQKVNFVVARLRRLIAPLDVDVFLHDMLSGTNHKHSSRWLECDPAQFLDELFSDVHASYRASTTATHKATLASITNQDGKVFGRASINFTRTGGRQSTSTAYVSVGGFAYPSSNPLLRSSAVGVFLGEPETAAREAGYPTIGLDLLATWATKQADNCNPKNYPPDALVHAAHAILDFGGTPGSLPFCICGGRLVSWNEFERAVSGINVVHVGVDVKYNNENFRLMSGNVVGLFELAGLARPDYVAIVDLETSRTDLLQEEGKTETIVEQGSGRVEEADLNLSRSLRSLLTALERIWGRVHKEFLFQEIQTHASTFLEGPNRRWVLSIGKNDVPPIEGRPDEV